MIVVLDGLDAKKLGVQWVWLKFKGESNWLLVKSIRKCTMTDLRHEKKTMVLNYKMLERANPFLGREGRNILILIVYAVIFLLIVYAVILLLITY